jgi:cytochrome c oxidase subunit I
VSAVAPARPEVVTRGAVVERRPWLERATSADHKAVGLLYLGTALAMLAAAVTEFVLMRVHLIVPESTIIEPEIFNRLMSAAPVTFVVLFAIPLALGLASYLVPLQIGARGVAFPRLNQLSYWLYAVGAGVLYASFLYAAPESGTFALPPLSDTVFTPTNGTDAWVTGVALALAGFVLFAINLIVTVNRMRAPGMAWRRVPHFTWASTVSAWVLLVAAPAMLAALTMLEIDRSFDGVFFDPGEGGAPLLYQHLAYLFATGAYVVVLLAVAGAISEILPTFARKPIFSHRAVAASFVAIGSLGPLAWMQNMYIAPLNEGWTFGAMAVALALAIPIGTLFYVWIATLWGGTLRLTAASLYALAAISTIALGLGGELGNSLIPVAWQLANTTTTQADTLAVLIGGAVLGGFASLHYWFSKFSGRVLGEGLGKIALAQVLIGFHLYYWPMLLAGLEGQPVDVFEYFSGTGVSTYNLIASIGAFVLAAGVMLELGNAAYSWRNGVRARGHDPWLGSTLEWYALSPPPPHNFDTVPDVRSPEPLIDIRDAIRRAGEQLTAPAPAERVTSPPREPAPVAEDGGAEQRLA